MYKTISLTIEIADSISIAVFVRARIDLVEDSFLPPIQTILSSDYGDRGH